MCRSLVIMGLCLVFGASHADDTVPQDIVEAARAAYAVGDFENAFASLAHVPGLLGVVPMLDQPERRKRAQIFFDLGRIRVATGDTAQARLALIEAFRLNPQTHQGVMNLGADQALLDTQEMLVGMQREYKHQSLQKTTFWGAAGRSLVLPGWGQLYRGRKKRGYGFMATSAVLAAVWFVSDRSYRSANDAYQTTRLDDLRLDQRAESPATSDPFTVNFERAKSRADRANLALGLLAAVWLSGVFDHLVVGPAQVSISIPIQ